jgi:hypothetical protein
VLTALLAPSFEPAIHGTCQSIVCNMSDLWYLPCCREELVARLQMLTKAKEELMDANY